MEANGNHCISTRVDFLTIEAVPALELPSLSCRRRDPLGSSTVCAGQKSAGDGLCVPFKHESHRISELGLNRDLPGRCDGAGSIAFVGGLLGRTVTIKPRRDSTHHICEISRPQPSSLGSGVVSSGAAGHVCSPDPGSLSVSGMNVAQEGSEDVQFGKPSVRSLEALLWCSLSF